MCKVKARLKGRTTVLQTIGYRGKREARSPVADLKQARSFIVYKQDARGLSPGSRVTVSIGNRKIPCKVRRWSRGSRLLVPEEEYPLAGLSTSTLSRYLVKESSRTRRRRKSSRKRSRRKRSTRRKGSRRKRKRRKRR